jgi:hypothetical protein
MCAAPHPLALSPVLFWTTFRDGLLLAGPWWSIPERTSIMNRKLLLALAFVAFPAASFTGLAAQAGPAFCDSPNSRVVDPINDDPAHIVAALRAKGISVGGIEDFGGCIRGYVTDSSGKQAMAYFDPDTLQRVDLNGVNIGSGTGNDTSAVTGYPASGAGAAAATGGTAGKSLSSRTNMNQASNLGGNRNANGGGDSTTGQPAGFAAQ